MNKLITTNNGGYPFVLDDLRFVDDSVRESLKHNFLMLGGATYNDGFLLSMDDRIPTANDYSFMPGSQFPEIGVFMNGEIWTLPAFTLPTSLNSGVYIWIVPDIAFTNSAPGQKSLQNGTTVQSYQIRRAKFVQSNNNQTPPAGYPGGFLGFEYGANGSVNWLVNYNNTYLSRFLLNAGLTQLRNDYYNFYNSEKPQIDADLISHLQRLDLIDAPWTSITGNNLKNAISWTFSNGTTTSPAVYGSPIGTFNTSTSFLKCKIIGKTLFVNIVLDAFVLPSATYVGAQNIQPISTFNLDFSNWLGTNYSLSSEISGSINVSERDMESFPSNVAYVNRKGNTIIGLRVNNFSEESGVAWNYNYYFPVGTPQGFTQAYRKGSGAPSTVNPKITLRGSFQLELN